ncbi:MAG: hypothetical protein ACI9C4_002425, partial [Paraglaciecola sp.]
MGVNSFASWLQLQWLWVYINVCLQVTKIKRRQTVKTRPSKTISLHQLNTRI